jgi:hypothetical protein
VAKRHCSCRKTHGNTIEESPGWENVRESGRKWEMKNALKNSFLLSCNQRKRHFVNI